MTEQEMWQAVLNNDAGYDGIFFYAVKTTGIYCRPSCKSKPPKKEGKEQLFESYKITVCSAIREYTDVDREETPKDSNEYMGK